MGCSQSTSVNAVSPAVRESSEQRAKSLHALDLTTRNSSRANSMVNSTIITNNVGSSTSLVEGKDSRNVSGGLTISELSQVQLGQLVVISSKSLEEPNTRATSQGNLDYPPAPFKNPQSPQQKETLVDAPHHVPQGLGYILECESNLEVSQAAEECFSRTIKKSSCSKQLPSSGVGRKSNFRPVLPVFDEDSRHESFDSSFSEEDSQDHAEPGCQEVQPHQVELDSPNNKLGHSNRKSGIDNEGKPNASSIQKKLMGQHIDPMKRKPSRDRWLAASPLNDKSISSEASIHSKRRSMAVKVSQDMTFEKFKIQANESIY
jgi:hypothetical protein